MRLEVPSDARSVLVFGGAFDPPHRAHIALPQMVAERIGADWVLYIPAAAPPLKDGPVASGEDRIAMLEAALGPAARASVTDLELVRGGRSYTVDTLADLRDRLPGVTLRLLIGADQARQFHKWREAQRVIALAEPVVMLRPPHDEHAAILAEMAPHWAGAELAAWESRFVETPVMEASSTEVRRLLREEGVYAARLAELLPAGVLRVIRAGRLYPRPTA
ncbi:MAG: nicotinate (nicotinamide) nucleotide adenylyltransferase [Phycisphaerales bacterium]